MEKTTTTSETQRQKMTNVELAERLSAMQVRSVYSGKDGACCCGCSGNHRYNSIHVTEASKDRGYAVKPNEVNDTQVKKVVGLIRDALFRSALDESAAKRIDRGTGLQVPCYVSLVVGQRVYIAYYTESFMSNPATQGRL